VGGKALTRFYNFLSWSSAYIAILSPACIVGEFFFVNGFHDLCSIFEVLKKANCCLEKGFLLNIAVFEWLLLFSKDVTDAIESKSCPGFWVLVKTECQVEAALSNPAYLWHINVLAAKSLS